MKVNEADRPKVIALVAAIVVILGFAVFNFAARKAPGAAPTAAPKEPGADLPTASMLAEGKYKADPASPNQPNLLSIFQETDTVTAATIDPFRSPVPRPAKPPTESTNRSSAPPQGGGPSMPPSQIQGGGFAPVPVGGPGGKGEPAIEPTAPIMVKGIVAPEEGDNEGLAFIKVNDTVKGYRVGDTLSPGIKVTAITTGSVTVKIGKREFKAWVGKELKLLE